MSRNKTGRPSAPATIAAITLVVLFLMGWPAQGAMATHGSHHVGTSGPETECNDDATYCARGEATMTLEGDLFCDQPKPPGHTCVSLGGSMGGSSTLPSLDPEEPNQRQNPVPELEQGGIARGHLDSMDDNDCTWPGTPGSCAAPFSDDGALKHYAWHPMDGFPHRHNGWTNVERNWECDTSLPNCPRSAHVDFQAWYQYY